MKFAFARRPLFVFLVVVPNLISIFYFLFLASPVYVSRASLTVFNPVLNASSLSAMLAGGSGDGTSEGAFVFKDYAQSWDEFSNLSRRFDLPRRYRNADLVSRYGGLATGFQANDIALWRYYQDSIDVSVDVKSGIASVAVEGYQPEFAQALAAALLKDAVDHLSLMNREEQQDTVESADARIVMLQKTIRDDDAALAAYRAKIGTYDPNEQYVSDLSLVNGLAAKKADLQSQYQAVIAATPNSPDAKNLSTAMTALQAKIDSANGQIAAKQQSAAPYEALVARRDNDVNLLQQASLTAQQSHQKATQNRYYLDVISRPSSPRTAELPHRLYWIGGMLAGTFILWGLLR